MQTSLTAFPWWYVLFSAFASSDDGLNVSSFLTLEMKQVKGFYDNCSLTAEADLLSQFYVTFLFHLNYFTEINSLKYPSDSYPEKKNPSGILSELYCSSSGANLPYRTTCVFAKWVIFIQLCKSCFVDSILYSRESSSDSARPRYLVQLKQIFLGLLCFSFVSKMLKFWFWNKSHFETSDFFWYESLSI